MPFALGVVDVVYWPLEPPEAAERAAAVGYDHIDVAWDWDGELALPVGDRVSFPGPRPNCSHPAPPDGDGVWDKLVEVYRRTPNVKMEPWGGAVVNSIEKVRAMLDA